MSNINAVGFFELFVENMERATAFYEEILGITLQAMHDPTGESQMMSFPADMQAYGATGALVKADYARPGPGGTQIYFSVEDCAIQQERLAKAGGNVIRPKFSIGEYGFVALGQDTEGNIIGFHSMT